MVIHTGYNLRYSPIAKVTLPRMEDWARAQGYSLKVATFRDWSTTPTPWEKLDIVPSPDPVFAWIDIDTFIVNNRFSLSEFVPDNGITFASDSNGLCSGLFVASGQWAQWFLQTVKQLGATNMVPAKHEQDAIKVLCRNFPEVLKRVRLMPEAVLSNPEQAWNPSAFAYHAWSGDWTDIERGALALAKLSNWSPETLDEMRTIR